MLRKIDDVIGEWVVDNLGKLCIGAIALLILGAVLASAADDALMDECLADGRKHYECRAMLRGNQLPPPVVVVH